MRRLFLVVISLSPATVAAQPAPAGEPVATAPAPAPETESAPAEEATTVTIGGYVQPQALYRQDDATAGFDEDGFRLRRARLLAGGRTRVAGLDVSATIEGELTPEFQLLDGYLTAVAPLPGTLQLVVDAGQVKAPISRQELLSDANLAFPEKAALASLAPSRQLGARVALDVPVGPGWAKVIGGVFNGEGRNQVQNIDESFLFAGRLELGYGARGRKLAESDLDDATYAIVAVSVGRNHLDSGGGHEKQIFLGGDVAAGWHGVSAGFEYLEVRHFFQMSEQVDYKANGFAAHAAYLLPLALCGGGKLELGARVEEIDPNDTVPILQVGDPNQSLRNLTGVVSYYQRGHSMKAQLAYTHTQEVEEVNRTGRSAEYANDSVLFQLTYRME